MDEEKGETNQAPQAPKQEMQQKDSKKVQVRPGKSGPSPGMKDNGKD
ncbi:hypothetical protein JYA63_09375 [Fictibacillus nanhaiensis]|uniref:Uncharacterized protein n=1 Tax=Fictibacillus nanhaiensis TaxID=742169 RepID=A0ABS2ZNM5_9BACL|nr:hypothetical protein [Fictibacillus nanhaiensis]